MDEELEFSVNADHNKVSGMIVLELSKLSSPSHIPKITFYNDPSNFAKEIFIEVTNNDNYVNEHKAILSGISVEGHEADLVFVSHVEGLNVVASKLQNVVSFKIEMDISLLIPKSIQDAFFDVLDKFLDTSKNKDERRQFRTLVSNYVHINNELVFLITKDGRLEKFEEIVLQNGDFANELCEDLHFLSRVLYKDHASKIASWFGEHLTEFKDYHKTLALKSLGCHADMCKKHIGHLLDLLKIENGRFQVVLDNMQAALLEEEKQNLREQQDLYKSLIFDILYDINEGVENSDSLGDKFIFCLSDFINKYLSKIDSHRATESIVHILEKISNSHKIEQIVGRSDILKETVKSILGCSEQSSQNTILLTKIFRIIDNSNLAIDKDFTALIVSSIKHLPLQESNKSFFLQFIYIYSKVISQLNLDDLDIDNNILLSLEEALILQKDQNKRAQIRGVIFNIIAVYPKLAPKVFDFFKERLFSIYDGNKGRTRGIENRDASNSEILVYTHELTRIIEKVDIALDRKLSERLFTLALDHLVSPDVRVSATWLLELALSFDSKERSVQFIKFFRDSVSLPYFLKKLESSGDLEDTSIVLVNYLESVFVHGSISYGMFKQYLEELGKNSAFVARLYANLFSDLSDSALSNMGEQKARLEICTRLFHHVGDHKVKDITLSLERSLEYFVNVINSSGTVVDNNFQEREKILEAILPRLDVILVCILKNIDLSPKIYFFLADILKLIADNASTDKSIGGKFKKNEIFIKTLDSSIKVLMFASQANDLLPSSELTGVLNVLVSNYSNYSKCDDICDDIGKILLYLDSIKSLDFESKDLDSVISELKLGDNNSIDKKFRFLDDNAIEKVRKIHDDVVGALDSLSSLHGLIDEESLSSKISTQKISHWSVGDIFSWSKAFSHYRDIVFQEHGNEDWQTSLQSFMPEIYAVLVRANEIITGNMVRSVQLFSVISFINSNGTEHPGLLLEIKTGEGKSTITKMTAAIFAMLGKKVDIVTSSSVLAERDQIASESFFAMLGLSSGYNPSGISGDGKITKHNFVSCKKEIYKKDIVYGDTGSFEGDIVRDMEGGVAGKLTRGDRAQECLILDEVDSMLLDERGKSTMLAKHISGMEYLEPVLAYIWYQACNLESQLRDKIGGDISSIPIKDLDEFKLKQLRSFASSAELFLKAPLHLQDFVNHMWDSWVKSALSALSKVRDVDYVIKTITVNNKEHKIIAPVDFGNTGVVQTSLNWSHGLHQFLQLKHNLRMTPEGLITSFLSHVSYFKNYGNNIYGMTGTLGGDATKTMLHEIYDVNLGYIPTYREKQFHHDDGKVIWDKDGDGDWQQTIVSEIKEKAGGDKRSVLVIARSIADVMAIHKALEASGYKGKIKIYSRDDNDQRDAVAEILGVGDVIIATNLAGRGTDIKLSKEVVRNGGLHVIIGFMPGNQRVEDQGFGRAARSGEPGSGTMILRSSELVHGYGISEDRITSMSGDMPKLFAYIKEMRENLEREALDRSMTELLPQLNIKNELYIEFCKLYNELRAHENSRSKLDGLKEKWGIFLNKIEQSFTNLDLILADEELTGEDRAKKKTEKIRELIEGARKEFADFAEVSRNAYKLRQGDGMSITKNPALWISKAYEHSSKTEYYTAAELMKSASSLDPFFSASIHYNHAYFLIQDGFKHHESREKDEANKYKDLALEEIGKCEASIDGMISLLETIYMSDNGDKAGELCKQVKDKIEILKRLKSSSLGIKGILIENLNSNNGKEIAIKDIKPINDCLGGEFEESDLDEFNIYGIKQFFEVEERVKSNAWFGAIFKGILGALEMAAAVAFLATGNIGFALAAFKMASSDLMSAYKISVGEESFYMKEFLTDRGSEIFVQIAFSVTTAIAAAIKEGKNIIEAGKQLWKQTCESAKQAFEFASSAGSTLLTTGSMQMAMSSGLSAIERESIQLANCAREVAIEVIKDKVIYGGMEYVADLAIQGEQNKYAEELEKKLQSQIEGIIKSNEDRLIGCILIDLISSGNLSAFVSGRNGNVDNVLFADGGNGTKYAHKIAGSIASEIRENQFMISKAVHNCCKVISGAVGKMDSANVTTGVKAAGKVASVVGALVVPAESLGQIKDFGNKLEGALKRSLGEIAGLSGSAEERGMFMIKQALTTKLKVAMPGVSAAQFEGLIAKLQETEIIQNGRIVGLYPSELEGGEKSGEEKLDEIFAMKSGNDLRIFRDGMYHVRDVLIDLEHAYDPECLAAAKLGLEALKARIVKDARAEIFKKMRQEVINPVVNPILQEVADGFAAEAKSRWVLSEEQIREKIEESKRFDALEQELEQTVAMQELEELLDDEDLGWDDNSNNNNNVPKKPEEPKVKPTHKSSSGRSKVNASDGGKSNSTDTLKELESRFPELVEMVGNIIQISEFVDKTLDKLDKTFAEVDSDSLKDWESLSDVGGLKSSSANIMKDKKGVTRFKDAETGRFKKNPYKDVMEGGGHTNLVEVDAKGVFYKPEALNQSFSNNKSFVDFMNGELSENILNAGAMGYMHGNSELLLLVRKDHFEAAARIEGSTGINVASLQAVGKYGKVRGDVDVARLSTHFGGHVMNNPDTHGIRASGGLMSRVATAKFLYESEKVCVFNVCAQATVGGETGYGTGIEGGAEAIIETGNMKKVRLGLNFAAGAGVIIGKKVRLEVEYHDNPQNTLKAK